MFVSFKTYNYTAIQLCLDFLDARENNTQQESRQDKIIRLLGAFGYIVENLHSANFLHSVGTMWIYVNTLWQINVTEW